MFLILFNVFNDGIYFHSTFDKFNVIFTQFQLTPWFQCVELLRGKKRYRCHTNKMVNKNSKRTFAFGSLSIRCMNATGRCLFLKLFGPHTRSCTKKLTLSLSATTFAWSAVTDYPDEIMRVVIHNETRHVLLDCPAYLRFSHL